VQRLAVHRDEWDDIPHRLTADNGHFARVDWFTTIPHHTVSVTTADSREPLALLVIAPDTPAGAAWDAMNTAATSPRHRPGRDRTSLKQLESRAAGKLERPLVGSCRCTNRPEDRPVTRWQASSRTAAPAMAGEPRG
jgi:Family of unknown function (DUF5994)